eukprot:CAMPEP_0173384604 /NCGR_PEP_ID=MMETSP1356-20130122/7175_1 /TAXON_ID=77927 ORGANISM="Hemiselmis virescens, Strain PCC157" /NCGR_SAMPLE_ID=MMETSP1356 /ASSEMBLY_ACC=CAM_ASM_000847 /LENGTH=105 /DNA_ID=CAMNT_0014340035 /DNA_START=270 /DNA_END=587 /DNA_ORIENTATION=+
MTSFLVRPGTLAAIWSHLSSTLLSTALIAFSSSVCSSAVHGRAPATPAPPSFGASTVFAAAVADAFACCSLTIFAYSCTGILAAVLGIFDTTLTAFLSFFSACAM